jgi:L-iditol 2-dehydrogenase
MRVAVYYSNDDVRVEEQPVPEIGEDELLVKVKASGICGSDVMEWYRKHKAPLVLGHEIAGDIVKIGSRVKEYQTGERVFVSHHISCNTCHYCAGGHHTACETLHTTNYYPGGFSEYVRIPKANVEKGVLRLPGSVTYEEGTFIEPLGCIVRAQRLADTHKSGSLLVLGCGISGLLHIKLAHANGVERIFATDLSDYRMRAAKDFGATDVIKAEDFTTEWLKQVNNNRSSDQVIVCTGALNAFYQALDSIDRGGTIVFFAPVNDNVPIKVPVTDFWRNEITLMTSYGAAHDDLKEALELINTKRIDVNDMVTHRVSLDDIGEGFKMVARAEDSIKVIVEIGR